MKKAFTLVEIIIVLTVIMIMSVMAVSGTSGMLVNIRFTNAFNKTLLLVQQASNLAISGKNSDIKDYSVTITITPVQDIVLKGDSTEIDKITSADLKEFSIYASSGQDCTIATISYSNGAAKADLTCTGIGAPNDKVSSLKIGLKKGTTGLDKSFQVYKAGGNIQVSN